LLCLEKLDFVFIGQGHATALGRREPSALRSRWLGPPEEAALRVCGLACRPLCVMVGTDVWAFESNPPPPGGKGK